MVHGSLARELPKAEGVAPPPHRNQTKRFTPRPSTCSLRGALPPLGAPERAQRAERGFPRSRQDSPTTWISSIHGSLARELPKAEGVALNTQQFPHVAHPPRPNLRAKRARAHCVEHCPLWGRRSERSERRGASPAADRIPLLHGSPPYTAPSRRPCRPRAARGSGDCVDRVQSRLRLWELPSAAAIPHVAHPPWPQFLPLSPKSSHLAKTRKIDRFRTFFDQNRVVFSRAMWYNKNNAFCTERTENA